MPFPPVPQTFLSKKAGTLQSLALPSEVYSDKSPKGTVDLAIIPLINQINSYEGLVTTSSCAGRVSVYLEGPKEMVDAGDEQRGSDEIDDVEQKGKAIPGGKGGGRFLFVNHEPLDPSGSTLQWLLESEGEDPKAFAPKRRLVRFAFEPMILHIMAASLSHASPVLSAAIAAGFRESGVQSLKNVDDAQACPMVAVRTAGLGLEAVIGSVEVNPDGTTSMMFMVSRDFRGLLVRLANERFKANTERVQRFSQALTQAMEQTTTLARSANYEDLETRRARKRQEGLERAAAMQNSNCGSITDPLSQPLDIL